MRIVVTGTRGIPNIMGGVETHCEELFPRIAAMGHDVTVICRSSYIDPHNTAKEYKGVNLLNIYAPRKKSFEAIIHTFLAVLTAKRLKTDILHIHSIGPSLMTPLARILGIKVVVTHHGPDYNRDKWGMMAKLMLKSGERMGTMFANKIIVISNTISAILKDKYGRTDAELIFNGVNKPTPSSSISYLKNLGLSSKKYIFTAGRFVPEKNFHQLIDAFVLSGLADQGYKLVIAGDSDHPDKYSQSLKKQAVNNGVILTGFIKGEPMNQLFTNAALFVLPSSHEGLPITLLEAMSYDCDVLVSNIPANTLPQLTEQEYFQTGDVNDLSRKLCQKISNRRGNREYDLSEYDWDNIARQTVLVYKSLYNVNI